MRLFVRDKGFEDDIVELNKASFFGEERAPDGVVRDIFRTAPAVFAFYSDRNLLGAALVTDKFGEPYIWSIAVAEKSRGQGIGGALLEEIALYARELPASGISLTVNANNADAQRLYLKAGYRVMKFLPNYYGKNGSGLLMRRPL